MRGGTHLKSDQQVGARTRRDTATSCNADSNVQKEMESDASTGVVYISEGAAVDGRRGTSWTRRGEMDGEVRRGFRTTTGSQRVYGRSGVYNSLKVQHTR